MTEQVDLDALIAEAREHWKVRNLTGQTARLLDRMADALESTLTELRQERERASEAFREEESERLTIALGDYRRQLAVEVSRYAKAEAALSRAEETIEKVRAYSFENARRDDGRHSYEFGRAETARGVLAYIAEYGKQKEADRG